MFQEVKVMVQQSHYRPGKVQRVPGIKIKVKQSHYRTGVAERVSGSKGESKAVPLQNWHDPKGSKKIR